MAAPTQDKNQTDTAVPAKPSVVKVAGMWELGWNTPLLEYDLWEYPLRDLGVSELYMCPTSGIVKPWVTEKPDIGAVLEANPDLSVVWIDEKGETPLKDFKHPANALYITGQTLNCPMAQYRKEGDLSVRIETKPDGSNQGLIWAHQAAIVVLYDRLIKSWQ